MCARRRPRSEGGSAGLELAIAAVFMITAVLFVIGLARLAATGHKVEAIAADGARAASLERNTSQSAAAAQTAVDQALTAQGITCADVQVSTDVSNYEPGGTVRVEVECTAQLGDVAMAGFPGAKVFTASAVVPIETYRAG